MSDPAKETVIIVHGTWAAPKPDRPQWYQPIDNGGATNGFISKLNNALQERGSPARCWAHCTQGSQFFHWSGENSWIARMRAGSALAAYVSQLQSEGWRCHIVAHSHGGNVVIDALSHVAVAGNSDGQVTKIVTLGTPFIDVRSSIFERQKEARPLRLLVSQFAGVQALVLLAVVSTVFFVFGSGSFDSSDRHLLLLALTMIGLWLYAKRPRAFGDRTLPTKEEIQLWLRESNLVKTQLLALGSRKDEAWQVLHHMRNIDNPLAVNTTLVSYLFSSLRARMHAAADVDYVLGAEAYKDLGPSRKKRVVLFWSSVALVYLLIVSFGTILAFSAVDFSFAARVVGIALFAIIPLQAALLIVTSAIIQASRDGDLTSYNNAFSGPLRWWVRLSSALLSIPRDALTYVVRLESWSVLLAIAMGLEHYRFELPRVEQRPNRVFNVYEDIPSDALERAMLRRSGWIQRHLGDVSATFAKLAITEADITSLLQTIEEDQSLVHASYYTDDECIARIADWIAGRG